MPPGPSIADPSSVATMIPSRCNVTKYGARNGRKPLGAAEKLQPCDYLRPWNKHASVACGLRAVTAGLG